MLLIATDEAGYGPKLGPLVVAATAWHLPEATREQLHTVFQPLRVPQRLGGTTVVIDDSKAIYKPGTGLAALEAVVAASHLWCGRRDTTFRDFLTLVAPHDARAVARAPWFDMPCLDRRLGVEGSLTVASLQTLINSWSSADADLADVRARILTAESFNASCELGLNKADLLTQTTLELVRGLLESGTDSSDQVRVFCDRHGGRRYYAAVLQHVFPDHQLQIESETKSQSRYRLRQPGREISIAFTVKGDSFTPVALASMHAKYIRERLMESFNDFFAKRHRGATPLKPTAGYPVDAERFLADIAEIIQREPVDRSRLVRAR